MIDLAKNIQAAENRTKIISVIKTVIFFGRQGLALRGHRDSGPFEVNEEPPQNEDNFRALLRFHIDAVLEYETPDISNIEQFTLCVRYLKEDTNLKEYKICENVLQFTPVENTTGVNLAATKIRSLEDSNIEVEYLRGQGYDGASSHGWKI
ncbi:hypothetical protein NQ314_014822 [Rhamnusium bicolor]|uniref:DUF4371 domain-containing protein n=1 Tax=Rhamnusium bicolor TaxID=1586634 RepID=A0AAV8WZU2_9CUCU|nr:hypothetical protein NQ314_014822 [Rhamnusium bicolor]